MSSFTCSWLVWRCHQRWTVQSASIAVTTWGRSGHCCRISIRQLSTRLLPQQPQPSLVRTSLNLTSAVYCMAVVCSTTTPAHQADKDGCQVCTLSVGLVRQRRALKSTSHVLSSTFEKTHPSHARTATSSTVLPDTCLAKTSWQL